jgi:NAD(P)H-hydrate epimerase
MGLMKIVLASDMRRIDQEAVATYGLTVEKLMENAALALLEVLREEYGPLSQKSFVLLCGPGNNGGDGFALARLLKQKKALPTVLLVSPPAGLGREAAHQWARAKKAHVQAIILDNPKSMAEAEKVLRKCDVAVDALFGTGLSRPVEGVARDAVRLLNTSRKPVVAVDIPSGLSSDTGQSMGEAVKASRTVTFALPKPAFFTPLGSSLAGRWTVADIGIPAALLEDAGMKRELIEAKLVKSLLPPYDMQTFKGSRGRLMIAAGSTGFTGAATLCALGAQRIGAGLVTVACPESLNAILEIKLTEPMTAPVPEVKGGFLSPRALGRILALATKANAMVLGPGIGRHHETARLIRELILKVTVPMVVDADALYLLAGQKDLFKSARSPIIVTPHPGEAAGLLKTSISDVESRRTAVAEQIAKEYNVTAVLKGPWTVIAQPQKGVRLNPTGTRALGTAGTGDVLAGMIGGLLAQRLQPWDAATTGVFLHGLAGQRAEKRLGPDGLLAGDILPEIPRVLRRVRRME